MKKFSGLVFSNLMLLSLFLNIASNVEASPINENNFRISSVFINSESSKSDIFSPSLSRTENKGNTYTLESKTVFTNDSNYPADKIEKLSFKSYREQKKFPFSNLIPEIPQWAKITGSALIFCGTILVSQLKVKNSISNSDNFRITSVDSSNNNNSFMINKIKTPGRAKFNIEFKF